MTNRSSPGTPLPRSLGSETRRSALRKSARPASFRASHPPRTANISSPKSCTPPSATTRTYESGFLFPTRRTVYTVANGEAKLLDDAPLIDNLPIDRDAVEPGPREFGWRTDLPATVYWVKAADGGDPKKESAVRDRIYTLAAPFTGSIDDAKPIADLPLRFRGIEWGNDHLAVATELRWKDRHLVLAAINPGAPATAAVTVLYEGSMQDRYHNPGTPMLERNAQGQFVLQTTPDGQGIYFSGQGASPKGDEPFVAIMPIKGEKPAETRIWQSQPPFFETATAVLPSASGVRILARRESVEQSPNYFLTASIASSTQPQPLHQPNGPPSPAFPTPMPAYPCPRISS